MVPEPLAYVASPVRSPRRSRLAVVAGVAPFIGFVMGVAGLAIAESLRTSTTTPADAEYRELGFGLSPVVAAAILAVVAIVRVSASQKRLSGARWAVTGLVVSGAIAILLFVGIVASHAWVD